MENLDYHVFASLLILLGVGSFIVQQLAFMHKNKDKMKIKKMSGDK